MAEVSDDLVCPKLMIQSRVEYPHDNTVNPHVAPQKHEEAIVHDSVSDVGPTVPLVSKFVLEECDLPVLDYRVVVSQFTKGYLFIVPLSSDREVLGMGLQEIPRFLTKVYVNVVQGDPRYRTFVRGTV